MIKSLLAVQFLMKLKARKPIFTTFIFCYYAVDISPLIYYQSVLKLNFNELFLWTVIKAISRWIQNSPPEGPP